MHAVQELSTTDKNIDEIAIDSGFSNSHAFVTFLKSNTGCYQKTIAVNKKEEREYCPTCRTT